MRKPRVIVCSPYAGNREKNLAYADAAMLDALMRGEAPFLSHVLYPRVLDDEDKNSRLSGLAAEEAWLDVCDYVVVYMDRGMTPGMSRAVTSALGLGKHVEYRHLGSHWA